MNAKKGIGRKHQAAGAFVVLAMTLVAGPALGQEKLSGSVKLDGSSTVAPITMATAEMFMGQQPRVRVTVGISGTGGGFKKFLAERADLRTDISDASRPIKASERARAAKLGIHFVEIPIGMDGVAIMVHPSNTFCDYLTVKELKKIWEPGSAITQWSQVRKGFPDLPIKLYGPTSDNGTFDYFTEAICGKDRASRSDYMASVTPNVLVQGIAGDKGSLGYFSYSYYAANKDKLRLVAVQNGSAGPVTPSLDIIRSGSYTPLSRPLFLYVNTESYKKPEVKAFLTYFFDHAASILENPRVNYVALSEEFYELDRRRLERSRTGSAMAQREDGDGVDLLTLYRTH
ncbi:MAG: PstS family phosphate ABC transporter substrate-binding protein [Phycisphaerae bacterium]